MKRINTAELPLVPENSSINENNTGLGIINCNTKKVLLPTYKESFSYTEDKFIPSIVADYLVANPKDIPSRWKKSPDGNNFMRIIFRGTTFFHEGMHIYYYYVTLEIDIKLDFIKKGILQIGANSSEYGYVPLLE